MPITIKQQQLRYRDPVTGQYKGLDILSEGRAGQQIASIEEAGAAQIAYVQQARAAQVELVNQAGTTQITAIQTEGTTQKNAVTSEGTTQKNAITTLTNTKKQEITDEGTTQKSAVTTEGTTQVGNVRSQGATQVAAVQAKANDITQLARSSVAEVAAEKISELAKNVSANRVIIAKGDNTWEWKDPPYVLTANVITTAATSGKFWDSNTTQTAITSAITNLAQGATKDKIMMVTSNNTWGWATAPYVLSADVITGTAASGKLWDSNTIQTKLTTISNSIPQISDSGTASTTTLWSSKKVSDTFGALPTIDDSNTASTSKLWSAKKINDTFAALPAIDDSGTATTSKLWSAKKISDTFAALPTISDSETSSTSKLWSAKKINDTFAALPAISDSGSVATTSLWSSKKISDTFAALPTINDSSTTSGSLWSANKINTELTAINNQLIVVQHITSTTPSIAAQQNHLYICDNAITSLTVSGTTTGIYGIIFTTGNTITTDFQNTTIKWPDWFDKTNLDSNTKYEINIMNKLAAVGKWI